MEPQDKLDDIVGLIEEWQHEDGAHHKQWLINQIAKTALGENYNLWVLLQRRKYGHFDEGIAP